MMFLLKMVDYSMSFLSLSRPPGFSYQPQSPFGFELGWDWAWVVWGLKGLGTDGHDNISTIFQFVGLGLVTLLFIICYVVWSYRPSRPDLLEYKYGGTQCDIR